VRRNPVDFEDIDAEHVEVIDDASEAAGSSRGPWRTDCAVPRSAVSVG
jgi:hypothetical protein